MSSYLAYYQANAQSDLKSCQKLASVRLFKLDCICGTAATEWISDSWGAFASVPHLIYLTNVFVSRILIENQSISCMQFSRYTLTDALSVIRIHKFPYPLWSLVRPVFFLIFWQPPAFPHRLQCSIIGRLRLNHRVRDGYGCFPYTHRHQKYFI